MAMQQPRSQSEGDIPFVGRAQELACLREWLADAHSGEPRIGLIEGTPGMGKSRLVREFADVAVRDGWQLAWGRCAGTRPGVAVFESALETQLDRAGLRVPNRRSAEYANIEDLGVAAAAFARLTIQLARQRPLILVLDDIHTADPGTLNVLAEFVRSLEEASHVQRFPLLVIAAHHPAWAEEALDMLLGRVRKESIVRTLTVGGLSEPELYELGQHRLGVRCQPVFVEYLLGATKGNPFFLLEALRELEQSGQVGLVDEMAGFAAGVVEVRPPATLLAPLQARLDRLPAGVLDVLRVAAVLGEEVAAEILAEATDSPRIQDALDDGVVAGVLQRTGAGYRFVHGIVRDCVMDELRPAQRQQIHRRILAALLKRESTAPGIELQCAYHLLRAGVRLESPHGFLFERAADVAMNAFAWNQGALYFEAALGITDYCSTLEAGQLGLLFARCARAHDNSGAAVKAREMYYRAIRPLRDAREYEAWGYALLGWRRTYTNQGEPLPAGDELNVFNRETSGRTPVVAARLLSQEAEALWLAREDRDVAEARHAVEAAEATGDVEARSYASATLGLALMRQLKPGESVAAFRAATEAAADDPRPRVRELGPARLASPLIMQGDLNSAEESARESLHRAREHNDWPHASLDLTLLHSVAVLRGDTERSARHRTDGTAMIHRSGYLQAQFILAAGVALERILHAEFEAAMDAVRVWESVAGRPNARMMELLCRVRSGRVLGARAALKESDGFRLSGRAPDFISLGSRCAMVSVADELDEPGVAGELIAQLVPVVESGTVFSVAPPFLVPRLVAVAARGAGLFVAASDWVDRAERIARASGAEVELGLTHYERARLLHADGASAERIATPLREALAIFLRLDLTWAVVAAREFAHGCGLGPESQGGLLYLDDELSTLEREVLVEFANGLSASQVADRLLLHERMVEDELLRIRRRTGIRDRVQARQYLGLRVPAGIESTVSGRAEQLTRRETEVLRLLANGKTNQQIAEELVISQHTAIRHVANIMAKTDSANRTEAAAWARQQGLLG